MKLTFQKPHLSITTFPETELPKFTLITGVNGAGKTHLLRAIGDGDISTDIAPNPKQEIKFFDWRSLVPSNMGTTTVTAMYSERSSLLNVIRESRSQYQKHLDDIIKKYNLYSLYVGNDTWELCRFSLDIYREYLQFQGHDLEGKVKTAYPCLKRFHNTGSLLSHIADLLLLEHPSFIPIELEECLNQLLS